jgi:S1-C subfamily serine protease
MKPFTKRIALVLFSCLITQSAWAARDVKEAMVKIYTVHNRYVYSVPWQVSYQEESTGSGCIIDGRRILTNAHVVTDRAFIQVRRSGMAKKHTAEVEIVAMNVTSPFSELMMSHSFLVLHLSKSAAYRKLGIT